MNSSGALMSLLAALQAANLNPLPSPSAPQAVPAAVQTVQTEYSRVSIVEVQSRQAGAWLFLPIGDSGSIGVALSVDAAGAPWIKLRLDGKASTARLPKMGESDFVFISAALYRISYEQDGTVSVTNTTSSLQDTANVFYSTLLDRLYRCCWKIDFPFQTYVVVYEDGSQGVPASVNFMRQMSPGNYSFSSHPINDPAKTTRWFLGVNQILYGARLADGALVFYSEPVPNGKRSPKKTPSHL